MHAHRGQMYINTRSGEVPGAFLGCLHAKLTWGDKSFPVLFFIVLFASARRGAGSFSLLHIDGSCTLRLIGAETMNIA